MNSTIGCYRVLGLIILTSLLFVNSTLSAQWHKVNSVSVDFVIKNAGIKVDGTFKDVKATISLNEKDLKSSGFSGTIESKSVYTGNKLRDNHLRDKAEFFDVKKYPTIEMKAISIAEGGASGTFKVEWQIIMKGITKYISSLVYAQSLNGVLKLSTSVKINRRDWKVGEKGILMNDMVTLNIQSTVSK